MSSTARGAQRMADDFYETPAWCVRAILRELGSAPTSILEPTAGRGAIVRVVCEHWPTSNVTAVEIDEERATSLGAYVIPKRGDFLAYETDRRFDLALTNPPFELAMPVIERCLSMARETVMMLRLNYLGSQERAPFWRRTRPDVYILPKRPSFAASLKCATASGCGWKLTIPVDDERPKQCPTCGGKVKVTTSDSCEYAWFRWGPGAAGRWCVLEVDE